MDKFEAIITSTAEIIASASHSSQIEAVNYFDDLVACISADTGSSIDAVQKRLVEEMLHEGDGISIPGKVICFEIARIRAQLDCTCLSAPPK